MKNINKENFKDSMFLCKKCLKKVEKLADYSIVCDYAEGYECDLCHQTTNHLVEIANKQAMFGK
jgi:hypothetical protein